MPVQIKYSKKHKIKEDRFLEGLFKVQHTLDTKKKPILLAILGLAVVVLLGVGISFKVKSSNTEARDLFGQALLEYRSGRFSNAVAKFKSVSEKYGSTASASKAVYMTASIYYELGNYSLAAEAYNRYIEKYDETDFLNAAVYKGLGCTYVQLKDYPKAIAAFETALKKYPDNFAAPEVRFRLAQVHVKQQNPKSARTQLNQILQQHPQSNFAKEARLMLASI